MKQIDKEFWSDKRILITGHTGFKGAWLSCILKFLGCRVSGLSDQKIQSDLYQSLDFSKILENEYAIDISLTTSTLKQVFSMEYDLVFHFAAQGLVSKAKENPRETINSNIIGTYNILEAINAYCKTPCLIVATTDKVYADPSAINTEEFPIGGDEFYSATKSAAEHIIRAFTKTIKRSDLNIGIIRSGNVLGGGDGAADRVITDILNSLKSNTKIKLRNPSGVRPWQYIIDSLHGYLLSAEYCAQNRVDEIFNLHSKNNNDFTVKEITESLIKYWGKPLDNWILECPSDLKETPVLKLNSDKAQSLLGWTALHDINSISKNIVEWEQAKLKGKNITFEQIDEHFNMTKI